MRPFDKNLLCTTDRAAFTDIQGIGKDPLYMRYETVSAIINREIAPDFRSFIAMPVYQIDDNIIEWYTTPWNEQPVSLNNLPDADKAKYLEIKRKTLEHYQRHIEQMRGDDRIILKNAIKYVNDEFIYCFDDKVVMVAWGMTPDPELYSPTGSITVHVGKEANFYKVHFICDPAMASFRVPKYSVLTRRENTVISTEDLPELVVAEGYEFTGWDPHPQGTVVNHDLTFVARFNATGTPPAVPPVVEEPPKLDDNGCTIFFDAGQQGTLAGFNTIRKNRGSVLLPNEIPVVTPNKGYKFTGWNINPVNMIVDRDMTISAMYEKKPGFNWLWALLAVLLGILVALLILLCLKGCNSCSRTVVGPVGANDSIYAGGPGRPIERIDGPNGPIDDNRPNPDYDTGPVDIIDDDGSLPDYPVAPPNLGDGGQDLPIITTPDGRQIIGNRVNVFFEDARADLDKFVREFKRNFPDSTKYKIIGVDKNVPWLQVQVPVNEVEAMCAAIPRKIPDPASIAFDESIMMRFDVGPNFNTLQRRTQMIRGREGWHIGAVNLKQAWSITKGDPSVKVAVVDDGLDLRHEMFRGRIVEAYNVFRRDDRLATGEGHGTHVAGLAVGSDAKIDKGVTGMAPKCKLMPVQVFDNGMCTMSSLVAGIMYAVHRGADVINVSVGPSLAMLKGQPVSQLEEIARGVFKPAQKVWNRIFQVARAHKCIIVFASGNETLLASTYPQLRSTETINVAAINPNGKMSFFSNYGSPGYMVGASVSAPGEDIISAFPAPKNYEIADGTSMAAPIVTGVVALMKSVNRNITVTQALSVLRSTGKNLVSNAGPMIQADKALLTVKRGNLPADRTPQTTTPPRRAPQSGRGNTQPSTPARRAA
ncbi:MAG: S8 family serine peptidase [Muribaculaceae bacterium]|nr:S8 family serine peptidase [Muribaculaceae bacterium]